MGIKTNRLLFGFLLLVFFNYLPRELLSSKWIPLNLTDPYPPPTTPSSPQQGSNSLFLPSVLKFQQQTRYYAQVYKQGEFYGVWATIDTPDPAIRELLFSYASINIQRPLWKMGRKMEIGLVGMDILLELSMIPLIE